MHEHRRHARLGICGESLLDESLWSDEGYMSYQVIGNGVDRLGLAAGQVEILDVVGHVAESVARREVVVEVLAASTHAADVQRQLRFRPRQPVLDVVTDGQRGA